MASPKPLPHTDPALVREVLAGQFPALAALPVSFLGEGFDHRAFLVGDGLDFRFPKWTGEFEALRREARLLRLLAPRLPLPVLEVLYVGDATQRFPEVLTGAVRLMGVSGLEASEVDAEAVGRTLGHFSRVLHAQDVKKAGACGLRVDFRPESSEWTEAARMDASFITEKEQLPDIESWVALLNQPPTTAPTTLTVLHGDLAAEHVLIGADGELTGILDWADAASGDPARDLAGLIGWGGRPMLNAALSEYGEVEDGFIGRAAWYALCRALEDVAFGLRWEKPAYVEGGRRALAILRAEFADTLTEPT